SMGREELLPEWFGRLNKQDNPQNAYIFLMLISLPIPFLGRTAIGWIIDVNTIGATVAYGYTSAAALSNARKDSIRKYQVSGAIGLVMSVVFFVFFMSWSTGAMATESYLILALWSVLGALYFRFIYIRDEKRRFGTTIIVWIALLFLIYFTTNMWISSANEDMTTDVIANISEHYETRVESDDPEVMEEIEAETDGYLAGQLRRTELMQTRNGIIQLGIIFFSLLIMFSIFSTMSKREKKMEVAKVKAEENDRAKSVFLSNMSHDIRTPMNAIIGYINLAERKDTDLEKMREYMSKIKTSSHHLLALINDVLEMSRIESGKMDLEPIAVDLKKTLSEVEDMFSVQMSEKDISFTVDTEEVRHGRVYVDKNRLNRVLLNLVSNAWKFTPEGGSVAVKMKETGSDDKYADYELRVSDSGIGMSEEFAAKVFEAFEREKNSTVSGIQGTGLGMSITKSIVELMGGTITVNTARDKGTEFCIKIRLELLDNSEEELFLEEKTEALDSEEAHRKAPDFSSMRLLLTEDMEINREIALMQLTDLGFEVECAVNGRDALEKVKASSHGYYNAILMDIQMPEMNGYEATEAIRALEDPVLSSIPIIAMTANAFSEDIKKSREVGMNAHIAKPIDVNIMINTLREILG
ncbi:MAG: amino acid permease, partial [Lachnospiraceae bacterium]|nr:amino acid permease [Lachnospiraceae bacterium]